MAYGMPRFDRKNPPVVQLDAETCLVLDAVALAGFGAPRKRLVDKAVRLYLERVKAEEPEVWGRAQEFIRKLKQHRTPPRPTLRLVK